MTTTTNRPASGITGYAGNLVNRFFQALGGGSMIKFLIRRLLAAIPVLFAIMLVTFTLSHLMPGGPFAAVGQKRMPEYMVKQLEEKFGLNKPILFNTPSDGYFPDGDDWRIMGYRTGYDSRN